MRKSSQKNLRVVARRAKKTLVRRRVRAAVATVERPLTATRLEKLLACTRDPAVKKGIRNAIERVRSLYASTEAEMQELAELQEPVTEPKKAPGASLSVIKGS